MLCFMPPGQARPECPSFGTCGGCSLQHIDFNTQITLKQQFLLDTLAKKAKLTPKEILPPIIGIAWGYRHRARLSVYYDVNTDTVLVGFHKRNSTHITRMNECKILPEHISRLIPALRRLICNLTIRHRLPQIEVAASSKLTVLVLRILQNLTTSDEQKLKDFIDQYSCASFPLQFWLQPQGPDSCHPFYPLSTAKLSYTLDEFAINLLYFPTDFTQVNPYVNTEMVKLAVDLLDLQENEIIGDFFCGIGNFTLPIAAKAKRVTGIEGSEKLIERARQNAVDNKLAHKVIYHCCNLFTVDKDWLKELGQFDKWLLDPPREGAVALIKAITPTTAPQQIVYVSCNPVTLARDASILVHVKGYALVKAGVINMFPHTDHVESLLVFTRNYAKVERALGEF